MLPVLCVCLHAGVDIFAADTAEEAVSKPFVASMGMYVIKRKVLQELLSTRFPKVGIFGLQNDAACMRGYAVPKLKCAAGAAVAALPQGERLQGLGGGACIAVCCGCSSVILGSPLCLHACCVCT